MKLKIILVALCSLFSLTATAQTNIVAVPSTNSFHAAPQATKVTTNYITAHPSFRRVNGTLYNVEKSRLWRKFDGHCMEVLNDGIIVQTKWTKITRNGSNFLTSSETRTEMYGPIIFLENYPGEATTGMKIWNVPAMKTGTYKSREDVYEKWDCGKPNIMPVVTTK